MLTRRGFAIALASGPAAVVLGPQCGPTNPPPRKMIHIGNINGGQWDLRAADPDRVMLAFLGPARIT